MAAEGVGVGELGVELDGPGEELEGGLVLLLEGVAVADGDPGLGAGSAAGLAQPVTAIVAAKSAMVHRISFIVDSPRLRDCHASTRAARAQNRSA